MGWCDDGKAKTGTPPEDSDYCDTHPTVEHCQDENENQNTEDEKTTSEEKSGDEKKGDDQEEKTGKKQSEKKSEEEKSKGDKEKDKNEDGLKSCRLVYKGGKWITDCGKENKLTDKEIDKFIKDGGEVKKLKEEKLSETEGEIKEIVEKILEGKLKTAEYTQNSRFCEYSGGENAKGNTRGWIHESGECVREAKCTMKGWVEMPFSLNKNKKEGKVVYKSAMACCYANNDEETCNNEFLGSGSKAEYSNVEKCEGGNKPWYKLEKEGEPSCIRYTCRDWDRDGDYEWSNENHENFEEKPATNVFESASECCSAGSDSLCDRGEEWDASTCEVGALSSSSYLKACKVPFQSEFSQLKSLDSLKENQRVVEIDEGWNTFYNPYKSSIKQQTIEKYCRDPTVLTIGDKKLKKHEGSLSPGETYIIRVENSCRLVVSGNKTERNKITMEKGWNIVGANRPVSIVDVMSNCKDPYIFRTGEGKLKTVKGDLQGNKGYIVRVDEKCEINLQ